MSDNGAEGLLSLGVQEVMQLLPHRPPMLLIDRLTEIRPEESARGIKNVTLNDPWFRGHFPEFPIMPGVLIVEAMAQTAGALVVHSSGTAGSHKRVYFMTIDKARFRHPVVPGDVLELPVKAIRRRGPVWKFSGEAIVRGKLCAEAEFSAMIARDADGGTGGVDE